MSLSSKSYGASGLHYSRPYVAGILATVLAKYGQMSPETLSQALKDNADKNGVTFSIADKGAEETSTHSLAKSW